MGCVGSRFERIHSTVFGWGSYHQWLRPERGPGATMRWSCFVFVAILFLWNIHWKTRAPVHHIPSMDYFTAKSLFQTWILQTRRVKFNIILAIGFAVDICIYIYVYEYDIFLNYLYKCDPTWPNSVTCPRCSWFQLSVVARRFGNFSRESERVKHSPLARHGSLAEFVLFVDRFSWQAPHNP